MIFAFIKVVKKIIDVGGGVYSHINWVGEFLNCTILPN